jgi:hypothetical protein
MPKAGDSSPARNESAGAGLNPKICGVEFWYA